MSIKPQFSLIDFTVSDTSTLEPSKKIVFVILFFNLFHLVELKMRVVPVNVLDDNFSYLLIDENSKTAAAIDPAQPKKVLEAANREGVTITHLLTTHHHSDHAGGNKGMVKEIENLPVYGGDDRIDALTQKVNDGDSIKIGDINVKVHFTPCHTSGHVLYEASDAKDSSKPHALFTGDTLFIGGCGRFFEGTPIQMYHALIEVISSLSKDTQIFCGHEYTVKNLEFALTIEPNNKNVQDKLNWAKNQRKNNENTVPSTVGEELTYNPFMRVKEPTVAEGLGIKDSNVCVDPVEVMKQLRKKKDSF